LAAKRARETSPKDGQVNHEAVNYDSDDDIDVLAAKVRGNFRHSGLVSSYFSTVDELQKVIAKHPNLVASAKKYIDSRSEEDGKALIKKIELSELSEDDFLAWVSFLLTFKCAQMRLVTS
jgi:hypothetical protein